ncbi:MAG: hypothetical protein ACQEXV_23965 [Bacillota bacterium]
MPTIGLDTQSNEIQFSGTVAELIEFARGLQEPIEKARPVKAVSPAEERKHKRDSMTRREQLIEQARADVERLLRKTANVYRIEFHTNPEKGAVSVLVRRLQTGEIVRKGLAKTAPGDVFNVHIGKAIALRRALYRRMPEILLNAPQPEGVKAGDIVEYINSWDGYGTTSYAKRIRVVQSGTAVQGLTAQEGSIIATRGKLVDDSREVIE